MNLKLELLEEKDKKGRHLFKLLEDYTYQVAPGIVITVPAGFITNFGTIPRFMWTIVKPIDLEGAAVVHDYLTNEKYIHVNDKEIPQSGFTRWLADAIFYEALKTETDLGWVRRMLVYYGVRLGAYFSRRRKNKDLE